MKQRINTSIFVFKYSLSRSTKMRILTRRKRQDRLLGYNRQALAQSLRMINTRKREKRSLNVKFEMLESWKKKYYNGRQY